MLKHWLLDKFWVCLLWAFVAERLWSGFGAVDKCLVLYWRCASWKWECVGQWRNLCFQRPSDVFLSQSRDCRLLVSCSLWEIRVSKSYIHIKLERNCLVFIIEGTGHGDAILKDGDWKWGILKMVISKGINKKVCESCRKVCEGCENVKFVKPTPPTTLTDIFPPQHLQLYFILGLYRFPLYKYTIIYLANSFYEHLGHFYPINNIVIILAHFHYFLWLNSLELLNQKGYAFKILIRITKWSYKDYILSALPTVYE